MVAISSGDCGFASSVSDPRHALHIADKENKKAIIMGEGSLPFIALDFLLQEGEFMLSLVLSLNLFVACQ